MKGPGAGGVLWYRGYSLSLSGKNGKSLARFFFAVFVFAPLLNWPRYGIGHVILQIARQSRCFFFARLPSDFFWNWCWNSHQTVGWVFRFIFPASLPVYNRVSDFQYFQLIFYLHNKKNSWHGDHAGWKERKILDGYMSSRKNLTVEIYFIEKSSFVHDLLSICEGAGPSPRWLVTGLRPAP